MVRRQSFNFANLSGHLKRTHGYHLFAAVVKLWMIFVKRVSVISASFSAEKYYTVITSWKLCLLIPPINTYKQRCAVTYWKFILTVKTGWCKIVPNLTSVSCLVYLFAHRISETYDSQCSRKLVWAGDGCLAGPGVCHHTVVTRPGISLADRIAGEERVSRANWRYYFPLSAQLGLCGEARCDKAGVSINMQASKCTILSATLSLVVSAVRALLALTLDRDKSPFQRLGWKLI